MVIEPRRHHYAARLVPMDDVDTSSTPPLRLHATVADLTRYPLVADAALVRLGEWPALDDGIEVGISSVLVPPSYGGLGMGSIFMPTFQSEDVLLGFDRIPAGEIELRWGSDVETSEGNVVGHIEGVVIGDGGDVSHVVIGRGHLWGRREITVPVGVVRSLRNDRVQLDMASEEVQALPAARPRQRRSQAG